MLNGNVGIKTYEYPFEELKFHGSKPSGGMVRIDENGHVQIAIHNNKWCASTIRENEKVVLSQYEKDTCVIKERAKDPVITLNGEKEIVLKIGESYTEFGVKAQTVDGEKLEYTVEITLDGSKVESIDTARSGVYKIIYQASSNGKMVTTTRIITVVETGKTFLEVMEKAEKEVASLDLDGNLRYVGADPNNYVSFNNELWWVIGVFGGQAKLIRDEYYSRNIGWNKTLKNDWSVSSLQIELNSIFLEGIDDQNKSYIDFTHIWKLGGAISDSNITEIGRAEVIRSNLYTKERGTEVYSGNATEWIGAIGLMYVSDYGYATNSQESYCNETMLEWERSETEECRNNNWLYDDALTQWTLTTSANYQRYIFNVDKVGYVYGNYNCSIVGRGAKPALYLKKEVKIKSGLGTSTDPFLLTL